MSIPISISIHKYPFLCYSCQWINPEQHSADMPISAWDWWAETWLKFEEVEEQEDDDDDDDDDEDDDDEEGEEGFVTSAHTSGFFESIWSLVDRRDVVENFFILCCFFSPEIMALGAEMPIAIIVLRNVCRKKAERKQRKQGNDCFFFLLSSFFFLLLHLFLPKLHK